MTRTGAPQDAAFGYLSTWDSPEHGCLGGYLIVSAVGRPLEFHCTAPIRTSRAQQILYGPTLWPYVLGEQIGGTLLAEAKLRTKLIIVDHAAALCLRSRWETPMVRLVRTGSNREAAATDLLAAETCDKFAATAGPMTVANCVLELPASYESDREGVAILLAELAEYVELDEPFERIREAICEAQRLGEQRTGIHEQAA